MDPYSLMITEFEPYVTVKDERFMEMIEQYKTLIDSSWDSCFIDLITGSSTTAENKLTDLFYLYNYLEILEEQRNTDVENGDIYTVEEYSEEYCLKTIRKCMNCIGIDVNPLYDLFGLNTNYNDDGIGYMSIEGLDPEFIIS